MLSGKPGNLSSHKHSDDSENSEAVNQPVSLTERIAKQRGHKSRITRSMSAPVIELKTLVNTRLAGLLQTLFDSVDDALFDLAEGAASNQQQNNFFESMREVRFKRVDIERRFLDSLQNDFVSLFSEGDEQEQENGHDDLSMAGEPGDSLSLMEEDDVEEMVAVDTMVSRYEKLLAIPLDALNARLSHLSKVEISLLEQHRKHNPLSPKRLCTNFSDASQVLSIDIKARIVIFKLFEKVVLSKLPEIYKQANEKLARAGVLPNYSGRNRAAKRAEPAAASVNPGVNNAMPVSTGVRPVQSQRAQEFTQLLNYVPDYDGGLHSLWADAGGAQTQVPGLSNEFIGAIQTLSSNVGPVIGGESLIGVLDTMQHHSAAQSDLLSPAAVNTLSLQSPENVLTSINTALLASTRSGTYSLARSEREVITLVSLLFQFVLEDRGVAEPMRIAISRLQVPVIKLALQDANFFCNGAHPARRLLNELTHATIGWVECDDYHKDPLYQTICGIVNRVLAEFERDQQLFSELLADLKSILSGEDKRAEQRRKRLVDAEMGKDASEQARARVDALLREALGPDTPAFIREMMNSRWSNLLFLAYIQHGEDSEPWAEAVDTFSTLLWTVAPDRSKQDRAEILGVLPDLLRALRAGLERVNCDKPLASEFFSELEKVHMEIMQRAPVDKSCQGDSSGRHSESVIDSDTTPADAGTRAGVDGDESSEVDENPEIPVLNTVVDNASDEIVPSEFQERAAQLAVGQWIELREEGTKKRCRLVAILRNNGKRIFVDRRGAKACEFRVHELARLIKSGQIALLEDAQLFDKALSSIITGLRKQKNAAAG